MPTEGQIATGPNGETAVFTGGQWVVQSAAPAGGVFTLPPDPIEQARLGISQAQLGVTQQTAAATQQDRAADNARADALLPFQQRKAAADAIVAERQATQAARPGANLTPVARGEAIQAFKDADALERAADEIEQLYRTGPGATSGLAGLQDYLPTDANKVFNDAGQRARGYVKRALGFTGGEGNTVSESSALYNPFLPTAGDRDEQIVAKIAALRQLANDARGKSALTLGGRPDEQGNIVPLGGSTTGSSTGTNGDDPLNALTINRLVGGGGPGAAGFGATTGGDPLPPDMQAEHSAWLRQNLNSFDPNAYADFRTGLDQKYGFPADRQMYLDWATTTKARLDQGGATIGETIPAAERDLTATEQLRNNAVSNPAGAFAAGAANGVAFGLPSLLARDQAAALREASPGASLAGEVVGGIGGTLATGSIFGRAAQAIANPTAANVLARPLTADVAYGTVYGGTQADDPLYGAVGGAAGALGGSFLGSQIARRAPGLFGAKRPVDTLNPGERRVYDAANRTGMDTVTTNLRTAQGLGVPASIADVSPEVNTLTGAALRRSPGAAGQAREALTRRARGQYDRFTGAVARDLGPIANVPQQSEALIQQARAAAGPLYDEAYAAPGAGAIFPEIETLLNRPSMRRSMARARRIAAEEGRDPATLGFDLDDAGEVVLTRVPSWQTLDYVKRGIDDTLEPYRNPITNKLVLDEEGRAINNTLRTFLGKVDEFNPQYGAARGAYAGPAAEREALQQGQGAIRLPPDELGVMVGRATPSQLGQMRLGMQSALGEAAGRGRNNANPFQSVLDTPAMEQRLSTMYADSGNPARLLQQRDLERQLAEASNRLVGNSMTAERQLADQTFTGGSVMGDIASGAMETAVTGAPIATAMRSGIGRGLAQFMRDRRTLGVGRRAEQVADQIAPVALEMNPATALAGLSDMARRETAYRQAMEQLVGIAGTRGGHVVSGGTSGAIGWGSSPLLGVR